MLQFRQLRLLLLGTFLLLLVSLIHLTQGQADYYWTDILTASWTDERLQAILFGIRLPRLVIGILAGGALAMAGLLLQTLTRNPLASAGTLGINSGAFLFVSAGAIFFPTVAANFPFLFAFVGSCTAAILVFLLVGRGMEPVKVALTGMIITLLFGAITSGLQLMFEQETNGLFLWGQVP
nr:iron chelate uptake ABC transporter family permease subunit [Geomicrobium sp. JCM 19055]